jgi:hypothetical protein
MKPTFLQTSREICRCVKQFFQKIQWIMAAIIPFDIDGDLDYLVGGV